MPDADLALFVTAQDRVLAAVERELAAGVKQSHWMWFVFPQRAGLGHSEMSRRFAIRDLDHARRYLADPVLGGRLRSMVATLLGHRKPPEAIFGSVDAMKLRSCLTLFRDAATEAADRDLFERGLAHFWPDPAG